MRIFYASDVHGSEKVFRKFLNAGRVYKADIIILGGDITGKLIIPIIKQSNGTYTCHFLGSNMILKTEEERRDMEKKIRFAGFYPFYTDMDEIRELDANKKKRDELFDELMIESVRSWIELAEKSIGSTGIKCFIMPGNDDRFIIDSVLEESDFIINPDEKVMYIDDDHEMISLSNSNITPWNAPRDVTEEEIKSKIEKMVKKVEDMDNCIFNFHCPPYNSGLDLAPKLDKNLKPVTRGGQFEMIPVGSTAIRHAIEKYQPLLGLHGHIHESRGFTKIGRTICINPGSEYSQGFLDGAIVNLNEKKVLSYLLIRG